MFISLQHSKLLGYANLGKMSLVIETLSDVRLAMFDTHVFLLNEYFIELNTINFNILNKFLNWIFSENRQINRLMNCFLLKKWIMNKC